MTDHGKVRHKSDQLINNNFDLEKFVDKNKFVLWESKIKFAEKGSIKTFHTTWEIRFLRQVSGYF